jgi:hypothetical protein
MTRHQIDPPKLSVTCAICGQMRGHHIGPDEVCPGGIGLFTSRAAKASPASALDTQVAGGHYKGKKIQPVEYIHANGLNFLEGCIVKRITRWRDKPAEHRFQDLEKIKHEIDLLIELESRP